MSFLASIIRSVTEYEITITNGSSSGNTTVTEDLNYSTISITGVRADDGDFSLGAGATPGNGTFRISVSGSTVTATRGSTGGGGLSSFVRIVVTQYHPRTMWQTVQRGSVTVGPGASSADSSAYTATIGSKVEARQLGTSTATGQSVLGNNPWNGTIKKKDSTHVTGETRQNPSGVGVIIGFEVVDWR